MRTLTIALADHLAPIKRERRLLPEATLPLLQLLSGLEVVAHLVLALALSAPILTDGPRPPPFPPPPPPPPPPSLPLLRPTSSRVSRARCLCGFCAALRLS